MLLLSASAFADENCIDRRSAFIEPCEGDKQHFYAQGLCKKNYEFESVYCAMKGEPECINRRAAFITPCDDDKEMVFVQGQCKKSYEFEHFYCR